MNLTETGESDGTEREREREREREGADGTNRERRKRGRAKAERIRERETRVACACVRFLLGRLLAVTAEVSNSLYFPLAPRIEYCSEYDQTTTISLPPRTDGREEMRASVWSREGWLYSLGSLHRSLPAADGSFSLSSQQLKS